MGSRSAEVPMAILVPERCTAAKISATPASPGSTDSTFTEAGPRPGLPIVDDAYSALRVEVSGGQGSDLDLRCLRAGSPSRDGLQLGYKLATDGAAKWRGWNGPSLVTGWVPVDWGDVERATASSVTVPSTGQVVVTYVSAASGEMETAVVEVDGTVTLKGSSVAPGSSAAWVNATAIVCLPVSERLLAIFANDAYYSDDLGATWTLYSAGLITEDVSTYDEATACVYRDDILLLVNDSADVHQYVSTDLGASFQLLKTHSSLANTTKIGLHANEDGIHVVYIDTSDRTQYRKLGSAFEELDFTTATQIAAATQNYATITGDGAGTLWVLSNTVEKLWAWESVDSGATWTQYEAPSLNLVASAVDWNTDLVAAYANGCIRLLCHYDQATDNMGCITLGGWSNVVVSVDAGQSLNAAKRWGYGYRTSSTNSEGHVWYPGTSSDLPGSVGWSTTGAGTQALHAEGSLQASTAGNNRFWYIAPASTAITTMVGYARLKVVTGGSVTTRDVSMVLGLADGVYDYELDVLFKTDTITVYDFNGTTGRASASVDMTAGFVDVLAILSTAGTASVWYRTDESTTWTQIADGVTITNDSGTPASTGIFSVGNFDAGTADSRWRVVGYATSSAEVPTVIDSVSDALPGKPINARRDAIPDAADGSSRVPWIAAVAGPGRRDDGFSVEAFHDYAIEQAMCEVSPSPSATWRSTDTSEQRIVYDLGSGMNGWSGHGLALYVAGANFRTAYLEAYNGATWDTIATLSLDSGFSGLSYTRGGGMLYPNTAATSSGGRWLWEQELRGGWVRCVSGGTTAAQRIVAQSAGGWTQTLTQLPMIELDAVGSIPSSGTCSLVWPSGLVVVYRSALLLARYWRIRIPSGTAGEDTPAGESYYEAGVLALCRVVTLPVPEWGQGWDTEPNARVDRDERGTTRSRELGPPPKRWSFGWPSLHHNQLRLGPAGDYYDPTGGSALAQGGALDASEVLDGLLSLTGSGSVPVIAVAPLPSASGTVITDRTRFLYGRLASSVRRTEASGEIGATNGAGEDIRVETITIEGIP